MSTDSLGFVTCPLCGCACGLNLLAQQPAADQPPAITVMPSAAPGWGAAGLCTRGWQLGEIIGSRRRLRHPTSRLADAAGRVRWDEAVAQAAATLRELCTDDPASIGIVLGDSLSNEEVFAARQFADLLGTPNLASLGLDMDAPAIRGLEQALGRPYRAPRPEELEAADLFVCVNSNLQHIHPRAAGALARRIQQGAARMVLLDEVDQGMGVWAEVFARHEPGARTEALAQLAGALRGELAGGPLSPEDLQAFLAVVSSGYRVALVFSAGALSGAEEAQALGRLARALQDTADWLGIYLLPSGANTFGTLDILSAGAREVRGMTAAQMLAPDSGLRALILVGEDLGRMLGPEGIASLRERKELLLALSPFTSANVDQMGVALPVAMGGEREGAVRQPDGRLHWSEAVTEPRGDTHTIAGTLDELAAGLGQTTSWADSEAAWAAIRERVPGYAGIELADLRRGDIPVIESSGRGTVAGVDEGGPKACPQPRAEVTEERPFTLVPRSARGGWITDPCCQGAHILRREATPYREPYVLLAAEDAKALNLRPGAWALVATAHGAAEVRARSEAGVPTGIAILPVEYPSVVRELLGGNGTGRLSLTVTAASISQSETR